MRKISLWSVWYIPARAPIQHTIRHHHKILWSLEATWLVFRIVGSLWNLISTSAALLPIWLWNFKVMQYFKLPISWLQVFMRSYDKMSYQILKWGLGGCSSKKRLANQYGGEYKMFFKSKWGPGFRLSDPAQNVSFSHHNLFSACHFFCFPYLTVWYHIPYAKI